MCMCGKEKNDATQLNLLNLNSRRTERQRNERRRKEQTERESMLESCLSDAVTRNLVKSWN